MTCASCLFFNASLAECRRNAPIPVGHRQFAQWPKVKEDDWCGQYRKAGAAGAMEPLDQSAQTRPFTPGAVVAE